MDLMEMLARGAGTGNDDESPLDESTARQILTDAYAKLCEENMFTEGQFIRFKKGLYSGIRDFRGDVGIFIRYDTPSPNRDRIEMQFPAHFDNMDCIIGRVWEDGSMGEYFACSRYIEPA